MSDLSDREPIRFRLETSRCFDVICDVMLKKRKKSKNALVQGICGIVVQGLKYVSVAVTSFFPSSLTKLWFCVNV